MSAATNPITSMAFTVMTLGCKEQTIKAALESETTTINAQKKNRLERPVIITLSFRSRHHGGGMYRCQSQQEQLQEMADAVAHAD